MMGAWFSKLQSVRKCSRVCCVGRKWTMSKKSNWWHIDSMLWTSRVYFLICLKDLFSSHVVEMEWTCRRRRLCRRERTFHSHQDSIDDFGEEVNRMGYVMVLAAQVNRCEKEVDCYSRHHAWQCPNNDKHARKYASVQNVLQAIMCHQTCCGTMFDEYHEACFCWKVKNLENIGILSHRYILHQVILQCPLIEK